MALVAKRGAGMTFEQFKKLSYADLKACAGWHCALPRGFPGRPPVFRLHCLCVLCVHGPRDEGRALRSTTPGSPRGQRGREPVTQGGNPSAPDFPVEDITGDQLRCGKGRTVTPLTQCARVCFLLCDSVCLGWMAQLWEHLKGRLKSNPKVFDLKAYKRAVGALVAGGTVNLDEDDERSASVRYTPGDAQLAAWHAFVPESVKYVPKFGVRGYPGSTPSCLTRPGSSMCRFGVEGSVGGSDTSCARVMVGGLGAPSPSPTPVASAPREHQDPATLACEQMQQLAANEPGACVFVGVCARARVPLQLACRRPAFGRADEREGGLGCCARCARCARSAAALRPISYCARTECNP